MRHPAKFTDALIEPMRVMLQLNHSGSLVLDPFAGTGKIHALHPEYNTVGIEIEPEWAALHPRTICGDALRLPFSAGAFDTVCTSPTYGNRMADTYNGRDGSRRNTYRIAIGRDLNQHNSGGLQWGKRYRSFHVAAWNEARRVLRPGGLLLLNMKDHIRRGVVQPVTAWHVETITAAGFVQVDAWRVPCPGLRYGRNGAARVDYESLIMFKRIL